MDTVTRQPSSTIPILRFSLVKRKIIFLGKPTKLSIKIFDLLQKMVKNHPEIQYSSKICMLERKGNVFVLTITGDDEHRLNPILIDSIRATLLRVKAESTGPSVLITTAQGKFFSNGYDLDWAQSNIARLRQMDSKLRCLISELIDFPMPTIAAVTGHASAAGFVLALGHDYILMRQDRGFLYMSELDIGLKIPNWFVAMLKAKAGEPAVWRDVALKSAKITAEKGVEMRIVDSGHVNAEATVKAAVRLGKELVERKWDGQLYGETRRVVFASVLDVIGSDETQDDHVNSTIKNLSKL